MTTETCGRCRAALEYVVTDFGSSWEHVEEPAIPHTPLLGTLADWAPVSRSGAQAELAALPAPVIPAPEVRAEVITQWGRDARVPAGARTFIRTVQKWTGNLANDIRVTYARGPYLGANGTVLRERCEGIMVRVKTPTGVWFASWVTKNSHGPLVLADPREWENEGAWGAADGVSWQRWGTKQVIDYLKEHTS